MTWRYLGRESSHQFENFLEENLETDFKCFCSKIYGSHNHSPYGTSVELISNFVKGAPKKKMLCCQRLCL